MSGSGDSSALSPQDGATRRKSAGSSTLGKWWIGGLLLFAAVCVTLGVLNYMAARKSGHNNDNPPADDTPAEQSSTKKRSERDVTPPSTCEEPAGCPQIETVPPRAHGPVAPSPLKVVRAPREGVDFITLGQSERSYELDMPAPGSSETTIPVRFMPGGGYYLHSTSLPATVRDWKMEEWREGVWLYRRWSHKDGEKNGFAEKVIITINGDPN